MRQVAWGLVACASVIFAAQTAAAQNHWYVEGSAGTQLRMDASRSSTFTNLNTGATAPGTDTTTYDPGFVANLGLGYRLPLGFRVEGEVGYAHYSSSSTSPATNGAFPALNGSRLGLQAGGGFDQGSITANAFYDLPISGGLIPYIGGGVGAFLTNAQSGYFAGPGVRFFTQGGGTSYVVPGILGEVGLNIAFNANWAVVPSYRFEHVFTVSGLANNENIFKLGVRYSW